MLLDIMLLTDDIRLACAKTWTGLWTVDCFLVLSKTGGVDPSLS